MYTVAMPLMGNSRLRYTTGLLFCRTFTRTNFIGMCIWFATDGIETVFNSNILLSGYTVHDIAVADSIIWSVLQEGNGLNVHTAEQVRITTQQGLPSNCC